MLLHTGLYTQNANILVDVLDRDDICYSIYKSVNFNSNLFITTSYVSTQQLYWLLSMTKINFIPLCLVFEGDWLDDPNSLDTIYFICNITNTNNI